MKFIDMDYFYRFQMVDFCLVFSVFDLSLVLSSSQLFLIEGTTGNYSSLFSKGNDQPKDLWGGCWLEMMNVVLDLLKSQTYFCT